MVYEGITEKEAQQKLAEYGPNEIEVASKSSPFKILKRQLHKNYVVYLLAVTFLISVFLEKTVTAYVILFVIFTVITVSFVQEFKAEKSIDALRKMIMPVSIIIREGKEKEVFTKDLVPGDLVLLRPGERVPADCLVLEQKNIRIDESILSGEYNDVKKDVPADLDKYDDSNTLFMGTFVIEGKAKAKILHTGMNTRFGKIAKMISKAEKELPLQNKVNSLINIMVISAIIASLITGIIMILRDLPLTLPLFLDVLMIVLAICVAAFPEGFPVVLVTVLASGAYRMAKKNAIVTRMSIIETLGETTVICSDKTGTITTGEMTVKKIFLGERSINVTGVGYEGNGDFIEDNNKVIPSDDYQLNLMLKCSVLCNDSRIERKGTDKEFNIFGSTTEAALLVLGSKADIYKEDFKLDRLEEIPFSSERKMMSVLIKDKGSMFVYVKGAPDIILRKCRYIQKGEDVVELSEKDKELIHSQNTEITGKCFRTLALAYKKTGKTDIKTFEEDLVLIGLVAMEDPPREGVKESILMCESAGIKVKMITGDSKNTAKSIAEQVGLSGELIEGEDIDKLTDDELSKVVNNIVIFARVRPEHKLKIVKALKKNNEVVTMTGDGVNDAPALKEAHIGVAMGMGGTDASRAASDLILKDNHFSTIVDAIKEGRTIFANIQKFTAYQVSINVAQVGILLFSAIFGLPLPLLAIQILMMNIISDEIIALTLAFNPYSKDVMSAKPRRKTTLINRYLAIMILISGLLMTCGGLFTFYYSHTILGASEETARTVVFVMMSLFAITNAFIFRSFRKPVFKHKFDANKYLLASSIFAFIVTIVVVYSPINSFFDMVRITYPFWGIAILLALLLIVVFDVLKVVKGKTLFLEINEYH